MAMTCTPFRPRFSALLTACAVLITLQGLSPASEPKTAASARFHMAACEGVYKRHVQGVCTNGKDAIYWSWTESLVKTDLDGRLLKKVEVADHHGDLCFHEGRIYVAVNLGEFNKPAGRAKSWVYVYDAETLAEVSRHEVPEVVHGAGGMAPHGGHFFIVGGLPDGVEENYVYEYDASFVFQKRHVLESGHTKMGIQTVEFDGQSWWFGCYGKPAVLLRADRDLKWNGRWEFSAAVGLAHLPDGRFLVAENTAGENKTNTARVVLARADAARGLVKMPEGVGE